MPTSDLRYHQQRPQPGRQPFRADARRRLAGADRLHVPRRQAPRLGPVPGRLRDDRLLHPLSGHRGLRDPAAAGVPRGRPRARARDPRRRAAGAPADRAVCPNCEFPVEKNYLRCPNCQHRLKDPCPTCSKPVDPRWTLCPYCESELAARRRSRRPDEGGGGRAPARPPLTPPPERRPRRAPRGRSARRAPGAQTPQKSPRAPFEQRAGHALRREGGGTRKTTETEQP